MVVATAQALAGAARRADWNACLYRRKKRWIINGRQQTGTDGLTADPMDTMDSQSVVAAINPARLLDTALRLVEIPSPTCDAGAVADRMAELLRTDGFDVERPEANWPQA